MGAKQSCDKCGERFRKTDFVACPTCFQDRTSESFTAAFEDKNDSSHRLRSINVSEVRAIEAVSSETPMSSRISLSMSENYARNKKTTALPRNSSAPIQRNMYEPLKSARRGSYGGNLLTSRGVSYRATGASNVTPESSDEIADQYRKAQNGLLPEQQITSTPMFSARRKSLRMQAGSFPEEHLQSTQSFGPFPQTKHTELQKFLNSIGYSNVHERKPYTKSGMFGKSVVERQPIHIAAEIGDVELVKLLIWSGADTNVCDSSMCYPKGIAMAADKYGSHKSVIQLLSNPEEIRRSARRGSTGPARILNSRVSVEL